MDTVIMAALFLYDSMNLGVQHVGPEVISWAGLIVALMLSAGTCIANVFRRHSARGISIGIYVATTLATAWVVAAAQPLLIMGYIRIGEVGVLVMAGCLVSVTGLLARARHGRMQALEERANQLKRERDAREAIATAEERARIAREIHDIVSHSLGTMVVMADGAAQTVASNPERAGHAMERVRDTGRDAMGEMRRMLDVLRDDSSSPASAVSTDSSTRHGRRACVWTSISRESRSRYRPVWTWPPTGSCRSPRRTHASNGGPWLSVVTVTLSYAAAELSLRIVDDGSPATTASTPGVPWTTGHGLVGMRERAIAYGGSLEAGPRPGGGFEVHAILPIGDEQ